MELWPIRGTHFCILSVKSVLNWTNPTVKCPKLDKSKPEKTYFALNRCPEKKILAFPLVFGDCVRMETNNEVWKMTPKQQADQQRWWALKARFKAFPYRESVAAIAATPGLSEEEVEIFLWEAREHEFAPYWGRVESILALRGQKPHALIRKALSALPADMREEFAPCVGDMAARRWPLTFPSDWAGEQAALAALK